MSMRKTHVALLSLGHLCADLTQGVLPALLPFFIIAHHYSYAAAAGLVSAANLVSSLVQPVFGEMADRRSSPWLVPAGVLMTSVGMALTTVVSNYGLMLLVLAMSGLGLAAFHPEGARLVRYVSGAKKGTAMSFFTVGGNAGFAIGPLLTTALVAWKGIPGEVYLIVPALLMSMILFWHLPEFKRTAAVSRELHAAAHKQSDLWTPFYFLAATAIVRSIVFFGLNTFLPLYWITQFHRTKAAGSAALSTMLFATAVGTVLGGILSDIFGQRRVLLVFSCLQPVLLLGFLAIRNPFWALAMLVPLGLALSGPFSTIVVMGQQFLPNRIGVAAGVTLGLGASVGGVFTPVFGAIADHRGMYVAVATLLLVACLSLALALITYRLAPRERDHFAARPMR